MSESSRAGVDELPRSGNALPATPAPATWSAASMRVAPVVAADRARLEEILRATAVFRDGEVEVALELFDETYGGSRVSGLASGRAASEAPRPQTPDPRPDYEFLGAYRDDGLLVGYACYGPTPATDRTYDLYWIVVDPRSRGSGAGTRLLAEVERRLRDAQARLLVVETSSREEYDATRGFYLARGYEEAARVGHFYAPGDDRVIYTKRLAAEPRLSGLGSRLSAMAEVGNRESGVDSPLPTPAIAESREHPPAGYPPKAGGCGHPAESRIS